MTCPRAVEALTKQRDRLVEVLRLMDDGRWWTGDDACLIDEDEVCQQADRIGAALDVVERLAGEMAAEDGTGTGSQLAARVRHSVPVFAPPKTSGSRKTSARSLPARSPPIRTRYTNLGDTRGGPSGWPAM